MCTFFFQAYIYTKCQRIVGVEINQDLCQVQQTIINKYQFQVRLPFSCFSLLLYVLDSIVNHSHK